MPKPLHRLKRPHTTPTTVTLMRPTVMTGLAAELRTAITNAGAIALTLMVRRLVVSRLIIIACSTDGRAKMRLS